MIRTYASQWIILLVTVVGEVYANWCYWPDGSPATNTVQCGAEDWCCYTGDTCMSNGLCRDINNHVNGTEPNLYQIESCVNKDWSGCLTNCLSPTSNDRAYLWACDNAQTTYCCASLPLAQQDCCNAADITIAAAEVLNTATATSPLTSSYAASTKSSIVLSTATRAAETTPTTTTTASSSGQSSLSTGAKAGIGVGVGVGALLIVGMLATLISKRRSKHRGRWPEQAGEFQPQTSWGPAGPVLAEEKHVSEVEAVETERRAELEGLRSPIELEGDVAAGGQRPEQKHIS